MAIVGDVFGLNAVYDRQVENITNNNFTSWTETNSYGYYAGGSPNISTISKIDFASETVTNPANLPDGWSSATDASNGLYGYFAGGYVPPFIAADTIFKFDFSDETVSIAKYLPGGTVDIGSVSSSSYGYVAGGFIPSLPAINRYRSEIYRLDFSTSTSLTSKGYLPSTMDNLTGTENDNYGYFVGGTNPPTWKSTISRIDFSNETMSLPGNDLPTATISMTAADNDVYGYLAGGFTFTPPEPISTILRLDFSNETLSNPGNNLPATRNGMAATENSEYGYFSGGGGTSIILRFSFSTETLSSPGNLPSVRSSHAAVSGGQSVARGNGYKTYGYYGGGYRGSPSLYESRIERIDFSTQTDSIMASRLIYQHSSCNTVSSNKHGYFVGGFVPNPTFPNQTSKVQRFDFISEVVTELPSQASHETAYAGTLSNSQYGFIAGGLKGTPGGVGNTSQLIRLDFSSDSFSQPSSILTESRSVLNGVSDIRNNLGYFGGGSVSCRVCRIDLSSDTITQNSVNLQRDSNEARSYQSGDYGYWAGGKYTPNQPSPSARAFSSTQKIAFSTGTIQNGLPMQTERYGGGVSQDNYYAWYAAGTAPGFVRTSNVQRVELSTETYSNPGNPLAINRDSTIGGLSN